MFINIPRTRYTDFKPVVLEFLKYNQEKVNELVLKLYTKGMTTRDVSEVLGDFFGEDISYAQVSDLAEKFNEVRLAWEKTSLEKHYKVIYCDAIYVCVKRETSYLALILSTVSSERFTHLTERDYGGMVCSKRKKFVNTMTIMSSCT